MFEWLRRLIISPPPAPAEPAPVPGHASAANGGAAPAAVAGSAKAAGAESLHAAADPGANPASAGRPLPTGANAPSFEQKDNLASSWFQWLFEQDAGQGLEMSRAEGTVLDGLAAIVNSEQSGADLVKRMPGLIPQVLQSLRSEQFSGSDIARKISSDLVLVAAVIRLANNACQHSGKEIGSVEHAVIVIGQEGLRQLITTVAFRPIIDLHSGHYTRRLAPRIWEQAERCAVASRMLAGQAGGPPFEAFLAGLAQHVGLLVALRLMDQASADSGAVLGSALFCARLQQLARQLSCRISREWHFPPAAVLAIAEQENLHRNARPSDMGRLLALTDYLSKARILSEHGLLDDSDPALFDGLPASAQACYASLHSIDNAAAAPAATVPASAALH